jgi:hypothetical protein
MQQESSYFLLNATILGLAPAAAAAAAWSKSNRTMLRM